MANYRELARQARLKVLEMIHKAQTCHIASNFSIIDVATVLYENLKAGDEVVWSKGWASASIYYFLHKQGKITAGQLDSFPNDPFLSLAETTVPGVHVTGGSMGHGLPVAVGMALAKKRAGESGTVYCIMSDGEMNEGTTWEAAMVAAHNDLGNLCVIVDKNGWQAMGRTREVLDLGNLAYKWNSFFFASVSIDGHDYDEIELGTLHGFPNQPKCIIANTVKGKGVSFMEDCLEYHYKYVNESDYQKAVKELEA
jgi:transketolase